MKVNSKGLTFKGCLHLKGNEMEEWDNNKRLQISEMTRDKRKERSEGVQIKLQKVYNHTP